MKLQLLHDVQPLRVVPSVWWAIQFPILKIQDWNRKRKRKTQKNRYAQIVILHRIQTHCGVTYNRQNPPITIEFQRQMTAFLFLWLFFCFIVVPKDRNQIKFEWHRTPCSSYVDFIIFCCCSDVTKWIWIEMVIMYGTVELEWKERAFYWRLQNFFSHFSPFAQTVIVAIYLELNEITWVKFVLSNLKWKCHVSTASTHQTEGKRSRKGFFLFGYDNDNESMTARALNMKKRSVNEITTEKLNLSWSLTQREYRMKRNNDSFISELVNVNGA